jgi:GNAT superfamily N-acetyltransferase
VHIKLADPADAPAVAQFARCAAAPPGPSQVGSLHARRAEAALPSRCESLLADPERAILLAIDGPPPPSAGRGEPGPEIVGMAVLSIGEVGGTIEAPGAHITNLLVAPGHRRRGVGRALLAAAVRYAESHGVDHLAVAVLAEDRETHRYLARLGFAPLLVHRVAPVAALRRSLGMVDSAVERRLAPTSQRRMRRALGTARALRRGA